MLVTSLMLLVAGAEPVRIRVLIGDQPASQGVQVKALAPNWGLCGTSRDLAAKPYQPDAQGWVTLDDEDAKQNADITVWHPTRGRLFTELKGPGPFIMRYEAGLPISGRVVDPFGRPAKRARVFVEGGGTVAFRAGDGSFLIEGLKEGTHTLKADTFDDAYSAPVHVRAGTRGVTLTLPSKWQFTAQVTDSAGRPASGEKHIAIRERHGAANFGERLHDYFKYVMADDRGHVDGFVPVEKPVEIRVSDDCFPSDWVPVEAGQHVTLRMPPPTPLEGRVLRPDGSPATGVRLYFTERRDPEGVNMHCELQSQTPRTVEGRFSLESVPSHFTEARVFADGLVATNLPLEVKAGQRVDLGDIKLAWAAELSGKVSHADGSPAVDVSLELKQPHADEALGWAKTDENGRFAMTGLEPGAAELLVASWQDLRVPKTLVKLVARRTSNVDLTVRKTKVAPKASAKGSAESP